MFMKTAQQLSNIFNTPQSITTADYRDIPVYIVCGDIGSEYAHSCTELLVKNLQAKGIFSEKYRFHQWLLYKGNEKLSDYEGITLENIGQWYQHILLSSYHSKGLFVIHISESNTESITKADIHNLARQIEQHKEHAVFIITASPAKAELLQEYIGFSVIRQAVAHNSIVMIYRDIFQHLSDGDRALLNDNADIFTAEDTVKLLKFTLRANGYASNKTDIETIIRQKKSALDRTTGIGFCVK